ncbi:MAG: hypothetical protein ACQEQM_02800 [Thermoplasmatota archaeon]
MNNRKKALIKRVVNSYLLVNKDEPYAKLKLLQKYLKSKKIADVGIRFLKEMVDKQLKAERMKDKISEVEAELFTKEGTPKKNKFGSAFCKKCMMYKDYEKECPYCGSLEMTL